MKGRSQVFLVKGQIDSTKQVGWVKDDACGAIDLFIGTVRNATQSREVQYLDFEAYEPMALKEMEQICEKALAIWPLAAISIIHRLGKLEIGEAAVSIAASSAHRDAAFEATRFAIDTLKETVPIWKKEVFLDGEVWVAAHP